MARRRLLLPLLAALLLAGSARADGKASPEVEQAREAFRQAAELAKDAQWGAALAAFERSARLRPHAWTTYNIAVCERALGRYVRARRTFARALAERAPDADLPESTVADIRRFLAEIDQLVASIDVTLEPADASLAVDGQPLEVVSPAGAPPVLLAGTLPAGPGKPPPAASFRVMLDPGTHVFLVTREGFTAAARPEMVRPGERRALRLAVERIPATIAIAANQPGAVVTVDLLDVGVAPITLERPAGVHRVLVRKPGFDPYEVNANVTAGQRLSLSAALKPQRPSLVTRWWFWSAAAVLVAGTVITTYALTRPDPQRPPVDGGGLGWAVKVP